MNKIGIIIQARNGSKRLPKKMSIPFYKGESIFILLLKRLKKEIEEPIIIATTTSTDNDEIVEVAKKNKCFYFRGAENNVLDRYIKAAEKYNINKIIRVCADNPFLDITDLKKMIDVFKTSNSDYCTFIKSDKTPVIKTHYGFWAEGVLLSTLKKIQRITSNKIYLEHITSYIYTHKKSFQIKEILINKEVELSNIRLTIDTYEDFVLLKEIYYEMIKNKINFCSSHMVNFVVKKSNWIKTMDKQIKTNIK